MTDTHIKIHAVTPRVQYTGNGSTTTFPYAFAIFDEDNLEVYIGDTLQETGYTVTGVGEDDGGNVIFDTAPDDGVVITIYRNVPIERITDFQEGGAFRPKNINDEFDRQTAFCQQIEEGIGRCLQLDVTSQISPSEIIPLVERIYDSIDNIDAVADNETNINTVAGDKTNIDAVAGNATNINAVAGNQANIDTVAGIASAVSTVAGNTTDISNVATNMSDVNNCATNMSAIQDAPTQAASAAASAEAAAISAAGTHFKLFQHGWFDYQLNDMAWLRADTFSWQDGTVYSDAYNHLVDDYNNGTTQSETIGSYTISYKLASDGHKITTDETNAVNIYNNSGVAWYYILDTTNQRFKLPRTKWGFTGLRDAVGKYVPESLPNHRHGMPVSQRTDLGGGSKSAYTNSSSYNVYTDYASSSNSVYKDGAAVQQRSTQMYLYFYVGQFSQTATEQTAGLNSELFNGKVDLNASNLSTQGKSLISGLGMPSNRYIDLTLLASGSTYTAPANGWFVIRKQASSSGQYWYFANESAGNLCYSISTHNNDQTVEAFIPAKSGDIIRANYNLGGVTSFFRFVYAEGEPNV